MATIHPYHEESTKKTTRYYERRMTETKQNEVSTRSDSYDYLSQWHPRNLFRSSKVLIVMENEWKWGTIETTNQEYIQTWGMLQANEDMTNSFPTTFPYVLQFESIRDGQTCREHVSFERLLVLGPFSPWHPADHRKNSEKRPVWKSLPALG